MMAAWQHYITNWWLNRKVRRNLTVDDYREINRLLTKAGRRCAYDLAHASAGQRSSRDGDFFHNRAQMWQDIFNSGDDGKSYRDRLHMSISRLDSNRKLKDTGNSLLRKALMTLFQMIRFDEVHQWQPV